jgi:hypothetical protein
MYDVNPSAIEDAPPAESKSPVLNDVAGVVKLFHVYAVLFGEVVF